MAFEVKYHPDNATILKFLLWRASTSDDMHPNNDNNHFVAYSLPQYTTSELYNTQIQKQNNFLHNIAVIPVVNVDSETMYNELYHTIVLSTLIKGTIKSHLTHSKGKWLNVTTKKMKYAA